MEFLPQKYHPFVTETVRRVYIDAANSELENALKAVEARLARKTAEEEQVLQRCEGLTAALDAQRQVQRENTERIMRLEENTKKLERESMANQEQMRSLQSNDTVMQEQMRSLQEQMRSLQEQSLHEQMRSLHEQMRSLHEQMRSLHEQTLWTPGGGKLQP